MSAKTVIVPMKICSLHMVVDNMGNDNGHDNELLSITSTETIYKNYTQTEAIELSQNKTENLDELISAVFLIQSRSSLVCLQRSVIN